MAMPWVVDVLYPDRRREIRVFDAESHARAYALCLPAHGLVVHLWEL